MISETTFNHSLEPVKTIKINPSVSTVTVSNTLARFYVKIRFRFRVKRSLKPGVLHNTGACRKCAVNKVTYNYRGGRKRSFRTSNRKERLILIGPRTGYPTKTTFLYFNHISVTFFSWKLLEILENYLTFSSKNYGFSLMSSHRSWSSHRNHSSGLWFCYKLMDFRKKIVCVTRLCHKIYIVTILSYWKRNIQRVFSLISRLIYEIQHSERFMLTKALKELKLDDSRGPSI